MKNKYKNAEEPFCILPYAGMAANADAKFSPCCSYSNPSATSLKEAWHSVELKEVRNSISQGKWHKQCSNCDIREQNNNSETTRIWANNQSIFADVKLDNPEILYFDCTISNFCNLKCRMCNASFSTSWAEEERILYKELEFRKNYSTEYYSADVDFNFLKSVKMVHFKGGEPVIDPKFKRFVNFMYENNLLKNITIKVTTNGTFIDDVLWKKLATCKELYVSVSVESSKDPMYRYIRGGPYGIEHATENIIKLGDLFSTRVDNRLKGKLNINTVVQAYNIFDYNEYNTWYTGLRKHIRRPNVLLKNDYNILLLKPEYLSVNVLPLEWRLNLIDELYSNNKKISDYLSQSETDKLQEFIQFTNKVDELRNENIVEVEPRFQEFFNK